MPRTCPADNCPACLDVLVTPHTTRSDETSIVGAYRCPDCGETWTCSWLGESLQRREINDDVA